MKLAGGDFPAWLVCGAGEGVAVAGEDGGGATGVDEWGVWPGRGAEREGHGEGGAKSRMVK